MDVFEAVADPTRRRIVELIGSGSLDVGTIASSFPVTQPAISRHLRVLREAKVVEVERSGARRIYRLRREGMEALTAWVDKYRSFWSERLDALASHVEEKR